MAQRFEVGQINEIQSLTGSGADMASMGIKAFEAAKPAINAPQPAPNITVGGPA